MPETVAASQVIILKKEEIMFEERTRITTGFCACNINRTDVRPVVS